MIPRSLFDVVREGRAFLFLGAGASIGAVHSKSVNPPLGQELASMIAVKFLGPEFTNRPLPQIVELAISEHDLFTVQEYIAGLFRDFYPSEFHKLIPKFSWRGIATTNYDLIVERAYDTVPDKIQNLVVFKKDGERVEEKLRSPNSVMYIKLHGCITDISDQNTPLILTPEQYITHKRGRSRLFERVQAFAYEYPFIFIGYSLGDIDIRAILYELTKLSDAKPRSYIVTPNLTSEEVRFWESRKITHIQMSFQDFLIDLNGSIPYEFRALSTITDKSEHPVYKRFITSEVKPSESLLTFLNRDIEYIHGELKTSYADPVAFYKGYFIDWAPIVSHLDVRRRLSDNIMAEVILASEQERRELTELFVIKGHAGSGKSVILKRIAWDSAVEFDKIVLFSKQASSLNYESLSELYRLCKERIFLFIDPVTENIEAIEDIIPKARKEKIPLTIIAAERFNEWNALCEHLAVYVSDTYEVSYLSENEIEELISLLTKHKSLGYLHGRSIEEQREVLSKRAGRQLLVALHEATFGKPFSDIVFDEYTSITSRRAQSLYLTVCIFHRLRVPVRAGLISRVHGIPFSTFVDELFKPLEYIVFARMNEFIHDYEYRTRHSHIAEIVFERVLIDAQDRYDEYIRIIDAIDNDYSSDREAFKGLTNAKELLKLFRDPQMIRQIYKTASIRDENNPMLLQQEAIFEMHSSDGSLEKATILLQQAYKSAPYNRAIAHSLSELALKKAETSTNEIEKEKYLKESKKISEEIISKGSFTSYPYHTLIKVELSELDGLIETGDQASIERKIKEVEKNIARITQHFPDDSYIRDMEAQFNELINNNTKALNALEGAFKINKRSSYLALRLAKVYEANKRLEDAIAVMKESVEANPSDKDTNYQLAKLLSKLPISNKAEIRHHLRRSFTTGDSNYSAQFWYARLIYLEGERDEALKIFNQLSEANIDIRIKQQPRGVVKDDDQPKRFAGYVLNVESSYAFIIRDNFQDSVFTHSSFHKDDIWIKLKYQKRVTFELAFNYRGPFALSIEEE